MNNETAKKIIYIIIAIVISLFAVKFVIWLLPIILIAIVAYMIYKSIKKNNVGMNKSTNKKRQMKVIHDLDDEE